ncbi:hypothetical protein HL658_06490 [Azospirillum sp. RWY-5-1]|uniref:Uncharacterized protein n=1 Tax=Azospirillum oleiclasticum TaxID=2735135 RepID=A0ABX2T587_9PROT|nr:hypothetical protein [Azospirillum oleiclasticum]NYZ12191.1 hypothetical protein [Azospirillum oleiclasticum]NYZ19351.1 hypothetical protein [Azospirillum oleiclasticum]
MADDEIKTLLRQIVDYLPKLATKEELSELREQVTGLRKHVDDGFARLDAKIDVESRVINTRLDEQGKVLVALIPTRIAAIPPAAE